MLSLLVIVGSLVATFVGFNIGGSSTRVAFGPAVGSRLVRKTTAAALFTAFAFLDAWTVGRNVIVTMSEGIVPAVQFNPVAGSACCSSAAFRCSSRASMTFQPRHR